MMEPDGSETANPRTGARELLRDVVSTPSPSGEEDACAGRLVSFFEARGREVWRDAVGNVRAPGDDAVLLTSHLDTVPGEIPVRVEDGALWGRGSVDAKGSLCAMAAAAVETGASFAGVVGEEADSRGARHLTGTRDAPGAVVNGEPSGWDAVTLGYRGMLSGTYFATSEAGHSSRPEPNAVEDAMDWWRRATDAVAANADPDAPVVETVTAKPVAVEGGLADDGLAVTARLDVQFRVPASTTTAAVRETVEATLDGGEIEWRDAVPPVLESPRTAIAAALRAAIRELGGTPRRLRKTGTSDMNWYAARWGCPAATYGPGDSSLDHAPDERLPLAEFDRSVAVLERVCDRLIE